MLLERGTTPELSPRKSPLLKWVFGWWRKGTEKSVSRRNSLTEYSGFDAGVGSGSARAPGGAKAATEKMKGEIVVGRKVLRGCLSPDDFTMVSWREESTIARAGGLLEYGNLLT